MCTCMREDRKFNGNRETLPKPTEKHTFLLVRVPDTQFKGGGVGLIDQGARDHLTPTVSISPTSWFLADTLVSVIVPNHKCTFV